MDEKVLNNIKKIFNRVFNEVGMETTSKDLTASYQTLLTDYGNKFTDYLSKQTGDEEKKKENTFMMAYRLTGESKVQGITDFMETLIENNCKFIVFAHHQAVMDALEEFTRTKKVGYVRIDGKVGIDQRHESVTAF